MKIKLLTSLLIIIIAFCSLSFNVSENHPLRASKPPVGYTGATAGVYCSSCHSSNALNNPGGSVQVTGLPNGTYTAGMQYDFSLTIQHTANDRKKWGFSITAVNSLNQTIGTFSTTNSNAGINGNELSHNNAVTTAAGSTYTYTNLKWTAPTTPGVNDQTITFYYVANAANGNGNNAGDYIYAGTTTASNFQTYTFTGNGSWRSITNWSNGQLPPAVLNGNAEIVIDHTNGGECLLDTIQHVGTGAKITIKSGKNLNIVKDLNINN